MSNVPLSTNKTTVYIWTKPHQYKYHSIDVDNNTKIIHQCNTEAGRDNSYTGIMMMMIMNIIILIIFYLLCKHAISRGFGAVTMYRDT